MGVSARRAPVPGALGRLASRVYARGLAKRTERFDRGEGVVRFDRPVVSVGNLSVGGTGKTPMVHWIIRSLRDAGHDPCVAMRGYRARGGTSDEAIEHAERFDDLPVVAQPDRADGLVELFASDRGGRVDAIVLDDGFQHRRLARDLDLVLIDTTRSPFEDALLPAGWLREPVESLRRATHVALTHAEAADAAQIETIAALVRDVRSLAPDAVVRHTWGSVRMYEHGGGASQKREVPLNALRGRRAFVVCALGNPAPFVRAAEQTCGPLAGTLLLRDHAPYSPSSVATIARRVRESAADLVLTSAKDWVKLHAHAGEVPVPVGVPRLELAFDAGEDSLRRDVLAAAAHEPE